MDNRSNKNVNNNNSSATQRLMKSNGFGFDRKITDLKEARIRNRSS